MDVLVLPLKAVLSMSVDSSVDIIFEWYSLFSFQCLDWRNMVRFQTDKFASCARKMHAWLLFLKQLIYCSYFVTLKILHACNI